MRELEKRLDISDKTLRRLSRNTEAFLKKIEVCCRDARQVVFLTPNV
jgi:hypothetical protein